MLLRQTLLYLPAQVVGPVAQVVAAVVWTHWLPPAPYGLLTFLIASQELVFLVSLSWWTHFTMRYLGALDPAQTASFVRSEVPTLALSFVIQIVVTLLVLGLLSEPISPRLALAAVLYTSTRSVVVHLGERARVQNRIAVYTLGQMAGSVAGFAIALVAVSQVSATPEAILFSFALAQAVGLAAMARALGVNAVAILPRKETLGAAVRYGAPLLVAGGFAWIALNGIRLVVEHWAGATALGLLAVGWGLGQRLSITLAMLVVAASFPLAVRSLHGGSREDAYRQLSLGGALLMGLIVPASIGVCFLASPFVSSFVAAPFRDITIAVLPYAAATATVRNIRMHIADPVFLLIERTRINTLINIIDTIAALLGCGVGLYAGGLVGATIGSLTGACISTVAGFVLADRIAGFTFPFEDALRIVGASALMTLALVLVPLDAMHPPPLTRMAMIVIVGVAVYGLAILALYPSILRGARRRLVAVWG